MKTSITRHFLNKSKLKPRLCIGCYLYLWQSWLAGFQLLKRVETMKASGRKIWNSLRESKLNPVHAVRVGVALLTSLHNSKAVAKAFPRFVVGLVCLIWMAPYADIFYTRLDFNDRVSADVWYYESYHWLFLCLGPYLKSILQVIGIYLCLVHSSGLKNYIIAYPLAFDVGKVLWLLQVNSHPEYLKVPTWLFIGYGAVTSLLIVTILDKLTFWLNHRVHAIKKRFEGLRLIAYSVDAETFRSNVVKTMDDSSKVQQFKA